MKKVLVLLVAVLAFNTTSAQEIVKTEKPIFRGSGLTIEKFQKEKIILLFRNAEYEYINDYKSVVFKNTDKASLFFTKVVELIDTPKTDKEEHLRIGFNEYELVRYGFAQSSVYLKSDGGYISITKIIANKVIKSLNK